MEAVGISVVDLTEVKGDSLAHGKFAASEPVVRLIGRQLATHSMNEGRTSLRDRFVLRAEDLGEFVGKAAGSAISLPVGIAAGVLNTRE